MILLGARNNYVAVFKACFISHVTAGLHVVLVCVQHDVNEGY